MLHVIGRHSMFYVADVAYVWCKFNVLKLKCIFIEYSKLLFG